MRADLRMKTVDGRTNRIDIPFRSVRLKTRPGEQRTKSDYERASVGKRITYARTFVVNFVGCLAVRRRKRIRPVRSATDGYVGNRRSRVNRYIEEGEKEEQPNYNYLRRRKRTDGIRTRSVGDKEGSLVLFSSPSIDATDRDARHTCRGKIV